MMTLTGLSPYWQLRLVAALAILGAIAGVSDRSIAQIAPDATLGAERSQVTSTGPGSAQIDGGATRGQNLFHSFSQFSVPTGGVAFFNNAAAIRNIISRVTGGSVSNIYGILRANGAANLFLINPNGIVFGPNASLQIGGSFVASTADRMNFADGTVFSATAPQTTPLLTISVPLGLQFGANPGSIGVQGDGQGIRTTSNPIDTTAGLHVASNQTLALVGGDVALTGGTLKTAGGRIELGSVAGSSQVSLTPIDKGWALGYEGVQNFRDIQLSQQAAVDASGSGGGDIQVQGSQVTLTDGSQIQASTLGSEAGGTLSVNALDAVNLSGTSANGNSSGLLVQVYPEATGAGGNLTVKTRQLNVRDGAFVSADTNYGSQGPGGNLSVNASDSVELSGTTPSGQFGSGLATRTFSDGAAGDLKIATRKLTVQNGAGVFAGTYSQGHGGNLSVNASDSVELSGTTPSGGLSSGLFNYAVSAGAAGDLTITTGKLIVQNGAGVFASTSGQGNAGSVNIQASGPVSFDGGSSNGYLSGVTSEVYSRGLGKGGDINITARSLSVTNGAQVTAGLFRQQGDFPGGQGSGGNIQVNTSDSVTLSGFSSTGFSSGLLALSERGASGPAGNITVNTGDFRVADGAIVAASTFNSGKGGDIRINVNNFEAVNGGQVVSNTSSSGNAGTIKLNATNRIALSGSNPNHTAQLAGVAQSLSSLLFPNTQLSDVVFNQGSPSGLFASTASGSTGNGGNISIDPNQLTIANGAVVSVGSQGFGNGGFLQVQANSLTLDNKASLSAIANSGAGGDITLTVPDLLLMRHGSQIATNAGNASGNGNGGNIAINTRFLVALPSENSDISGNAFTGRGGNVNIAAQGIFGIQSRQQRNPESDITSSGTIGISTLVVNPVLGVVVLPTGLVDVSKLIAPSCPAYAQAQPKKIVVTPLPDANSSTQSRNRNTRPNRTDADTDPIAALPEPSKFVYTGRGGMPPSPRDPLSSDAVLTNWSTLNPRAKHRSGTPHSSNPTSPTPTQIVEATGWMVNDKGQVVLTAQAPTVAPDIPWLKPTTCYTR